MTNIKIDMTWKILR